MSVLTPVPATATTSTAARGKRGSANSSVSGHRIAPRLRSGSRAAAAAAAAASSTAAASAASASISSAVLAEWVAAHGGYITAVRIDSGSRGRGLFAARRITQGEAVLTMPISLALNDGVAPAPYPDAPWSVTLAAAILRERDLGAASSW